MAGVIERLPKEGLPSGSSTQSQQKLEAENKKLMDQNKKLVAEQKARAAKLQRARSISRRIATRTARNVATDLTAMVGEATPYVGIGLVVAATVLDAKDGCDTMQDVNEILVELEDDKPLEDSDAVCGIRVPTAAEVTASVQEKVGGTLHQSEEMIRESSKSFSEALGGTLYEIFH